MADIDLLSASNGSGEAVTALVTAIRTAGSGVLTVDFTTNWPANFIATTGKLLSNNTLDPTTVFVFNGHLTGATITIDSAAPGYTDTRGNAIGDVVVIKPTTRWANIVSSTVNAINTQANTIQNTQIPQLTSDALFDFVKSGGVWTGDAYGSTRNASMTAIVVYINGQRGTIAAVTARAFTASKDTYIDVLNTAGVFTLVYTEVANNAASPALAANSIRIGIIVTGASNIAAAGSVNQGQETMILPIASSIAYTVTDSLGNLICPRDPNRKVLGYKQITGNFGTASSTEVPITGLSMPIIIPTGRRVKLTTHFFKISNSLAGASNTVVGIWDGVAGAGTELAQTGVTSGGANYGAAGIATWLGIPSTGTKTYTAGIKNQGGTTATAEAGATNPGYILAELY